MLNTSDIKMQKTIPSNRSDSVRLQTVAYWSIFALTLLSLYFPIFRYVGYSAPFIAILAGLADGRLHTPEIIRPYLFIVVIGLALSPLADSAGFKDLFFLVSGISAFLVVKNIKAYPTQFLLLFGIGTVVFWVMTGGPSNGLFFDFAHSASSFEGNFSFLFGLLAVYAAVKRLNWVFLFSLIGTVITLKRIAIAAVLLCWLISHLPERFVRRLLNPVVLLAANLTIILVLVLYANHQLDYLIGLATGQSANQLGQGRQDLYATVANDIIADPLRHIFIGAGPGAAYESLGRMFGITGKSNLHSDLLKIFYEYGLVAFSAFIWLGYRMRDVRIRVMFLYANILYATDNVLIYHFFIFFLCLFGTALEQENIGTKGKSDTWNIRNRDE